MLDSPALRTALESPEPTKVKRGRQYAERLRQKRKAGRAPLKQYTVPALDVAALNKKYGMDRAHHPRPMEGTFVVPLGVSQAQYEGLRLDAIRRYIEAMDKQGWEFVADFRIQVYPGIYPYRDLASGLDLLDRREFIVRAHFRFRNPQPVRIELPPELIEPQTYGA